MDEEINEWFVYVDMCVGRRGKEERMAVNRDEILGFIKYALVAISC